MMETGAGSATLNLLAVGLSYRRLLLGLAPLYFSCLLWWPNASIAVAGQPDRRIPRGLSDQLSPADQAAFIILLSDSERAEYTSLRTPEERAAWQRRYWNQRDPTPGTERNERYEEHLRRVEYARRMYSWPNLRGFDDRGEIYVRYGPPDDWYEMSMPTPGVRANESWVYHGLGFYGVFDFVDDGSGYYRLVNDLSEAVIGAHTALGLYAVRSDLSPFYATILQRVRSGDAPSLAIGEMILDRERALAEKPREADFHWFEEAKLKPMDFPFYHAVFRREKGALLEVYYGIPASPLRGHIRRARDRLQLIVEFALFDSTWEDVIRRRKRKAVAANRLGDRLKENLMVDALRLVVLRPGLFHYALGVTDSVARRAGVYKATAVVPLWSEDSLGLSSLELAYWIEPGAHPKFTKPGLVVVPNPARRYRRDQPCWLYFEIYNLS
ncbi:MAG TPA: GWxTD domain-containing protein, partial [Bacteroidetes bacterium]|nr:GWxTD domain-containing protein [Bacteroidota bacterium]